MKRFILAIVFVASLVGAIAYSGSSKVQSLHWDGVNHFTSHFNSSSQVRIATSESGEYTPTIAIVNRMDATPTVSKPWNYMKLGSKVVVWGKLNSYNPNTENDAHNISITLPIAPSSDFDDQGDCTGVATYTGAATDMAAGGNVNAELSIFSSVDKCLVGNVGNQLTAGVNLQVTFFYTIEP